MNCSEQSEPAHERRLCIPPRSCSSIMQSVDHDGEMGCPCFCDEKRARSVVVVTRESEAPPSATAACPTPTALGAFP